MSTPDTQGRVAVITGASSLRLFASRERSGAYAARLLFLAAMAPFWAHCSRTASPPR